MVARYGKSSSLIGLVITSRGSCRGLRGWWMRFGLLRVGSGRRRWRGEWGGFGRGCCALRGCFGRLWGMWMWWWSEWGREGGRGDVEWDNGNITFVIFYGMENTTTIGKSISSLAQTLPSPSNHVPTTHTTSKSTLSNTPLPISTILKPCS